MLRQRVLRSIRVSGALSIVLATAAIASSQFVGASQPQISKLSVHTTFHVKKHSSSGPTGLSPNTIKSVYNLNNAGNGTGTIALIEAYDSPRLQSDFNTFSAKYGLPQCNNTSCFEKHLMAPRISSNSGWELEASLDAEWAHAIAPGAKILVVEARSAILSDLLNAVNYTRNRSDVVAVSMSWGGGEFSSEAAYDNFFTSPYGATFFASAGDSGTGAEWPSVSPNVVGVGGTTLNLSSTGALLSAAAWSGSGGGVSTYESKPSYQTAAAVAAGGSKRAVPDVSYDADPSSGVAVYDSYSYQGQVGWFQVGGTSEGAPQWAAIQALGKSATSVNLYKDYSGANNATFLRDITAGSNGSCGVVCNAAAGYDTVTGVGSPVTAKF